MTSQINSGALMYRIKEMWDPIDPEARYRAVSLVAHQKIIENNPSWATNSNIQSGGVTKGMTPSA